MYIHIVLVCVCVYIYIYIFVYAYTYLHIVYIFAYSIQYTYLHIRTIYVVYVYVSICSSLCMRGIYGIPCPPVGWVGVERGGKEVACEEYMIAGASKQVPRRCDMVVCSVFLFSIALYREYIGSV